MKQWLILSLYFCCYCVLNAQEIVRFEAADSRIMNIPFSETISTTSIARYINMNFNSDAEKFRAIHKWVANNIKYDSDSMYAINWGTNLETRIALSLKRRKGVCENYAAIFSDIAVKTGLTSFVVNGYTKQAGIINLSGHSWCAVSLHNQWLLCDPTWDEGFRNEPDYFLINPADFIQTHMPFDPLWQLLDYPVSHEEFKHNAQPKKIGPLFNFIDSINAFVKLNELMQLETSAARMLAAGLVNELLKTRYFYIQMLIAIIYEDEDMNLYNSAVADLNSAMAIFNDFVKYRNKQFTPARPDEEISLILIPVAGLLSSAYKKAEKIGASVENLQYDTGSLKDKIDHIAGRIQEQQDFLRRYFSADASQRVKLFYK